MIRSAAAAALGVAALWWLRRKKRPIIHAQVEDDDSGPAMALTQESEFRTRSPIVATHGVVSSSQPLATNAGLDILKEGGSAVDAAVAVAAMLCVLEPGSTDLGGDCFLLIQEKDRIYGVNGSGRSGAVKDVVTVPGCVAAWVDAHAHFGKLSLRRILAPAIEAAQGFPISTMALRAIQEHRDLTILKDAEEVGGIVRRPEMRRALLRIAWLGKRGFYCGPTARAITQKTTLTLEDLHRHKTEFTKPLSVKFMGHTVWEHGPNGAGAIVLLALQILNQFDAITTHLMIEALRWAIYDGRLICDPDFSGDWQLLLSEEHAQRRASQITQRASAFKTQLDLGCDTVSFQVVTPAMAVSAVNSTYTAFGSKIAVEGFTLQNRGLNFTKGVNKWEPHKRPYHTIIPCLVTKNKQFVASLTNMGGFMQPSGHVQHLVNLLVKKMDPQASVEAPRFLINSNSDVIDVEPDFDIEDLIARGHKINVLPAPMYDRAKAVGKAQIVVRKPNGVFIAGSDPRADGCALGF